MKIQGGYNMKGSENSTLSNGASKLAELDTTILPCLRQAGAITASTPM